MKTLMKILGCARNSSMTTASGATPGATLERYCLGVVLADVKYRRRTLPSTLIRAYPFERAEWQYGPIWLQCQNYCKCAITGAPLSPFPKDCSRRRATGGLLASSI
ncbi:hypothetical protein BDZ89DRAFT_1065426 [Hymenopellis radicata]|nr:hypothetical protein BDZ89DRAFT_1065426 [Hymenopellis radicata]